LQHGAGDEIADDPQRQRDEQPGGDRLARYVAHAHLVAPAFGLRDQAHAARRNGEHQDQHEHAQSAT
jgi:hypothetical protein